MNLVLLQAGSIRKALSASVYSHRNDLGSILSSGWFWGIVGFCVLCVIIYFIVKEDKK